MMDDDNTCNHVYCREHGMISSRCASMLPCQTGEHLRTDRGEFTFNWPFASPSIFSFIDDIEMRQREGFPSREEIMAKRALWKIKEVVR